MRIVCMTNEGQIPMMKNMLRSAIESGIDMSLFHCYILNTQPECQSYNTYGFKALTVRKLEVVLENMEYDSQVLWIDNDVLFFENCIQHIQSHTGDFIMQDDVWAPCCGFFLVRSNPLSKETLHRCIDKIHENKDDPRIDDQTAFLNIYKKQKGLNVTLLPKDEYPNGYVYFNENCKSHAKMLHCNYLKTTAEKIERLKDHNLWNPTEEAFEKVNKYYI